MENKRLKIVKTDNNIQNKAEDQSPLSNRKMHRKELQARFDRLWLIDAEHMDPLRNCMERDRIERTMTLIQTTLSLSGKLVADLGCGSGVLTRKTRDAGAKVDALDISVNALKILREHRMDNIEAIQDYVPMTTLKDDSYDLVVSTELIAWLPEDEYRLYFSELARLVKLDGHVVCSTQIDINSDDALQRFANLAETEFKIDKWILSHHLCYLRITDFFKAPARFAKASHDNEYRLRELNRRYGFSQWWFRMNSTKAPAFLWSLIQYPLKPIVGLLRQNRTLLLCLEKICSFFWSQSGISHAIFIGQRRPMLEILPKNEIPKELKHKKQLWE
jgi:2-polyprenyl-3-methyl-5-hydroxy-6-metoxy-1,4-benzoquinol methylase